MEGASAGIVASQLAHYAINLARARRGATGTALIVRPSSGALLLAGMRRHALPALAGAAAGALDSGPVGESVRTAGATLGGFGVGQLAGVGAQIALAAATRGRARGRALPTIGGAIGGGLVLAQALDLTARHRKAADSGT